MFTNTVIIDDVCCKDGEDLINKVKGNDALLIHSLEGSKVIITVEKYLNLLTSLSVFALDNPKLAKELEIPVPSENTVVRSDAERIKELAQRDIELFKRLLSKK